MKNKPYETKTLVRFSVGVHIEYRREAKTPFYRIDLTLTKETAVWLVDPVDGAGSLLISSDAMLNSSNSRHVRFVSPYVILHFGSTTHIPAYSKDIIWSFLIPCERIIIHVLKRLVRPAWSPS